MLHLLVASTVFFLSTPFSLAQNTRPAEKQRLSWLLGGGFQGQKAPVLLDPVLPRGELRGHGSERLMKSRRCSLKRPLCVSSVHQRDIHQQAQVLAWLVQAYEEHVYASGLPGPRATWLMPLEWHAAVQEPLTLELSRVASRGFDRGRARCRGGRDSLESARRCVASAALAAHAPATASWLRDGYAAEVSQSLGSAPETLDALRGASASPHLGILSSSSSYVAWQTGRRVSVSRLRSASFFSYLEGRSLDRSGSAAWLALALGATRTEAGASRWNAEADIFDVLFATLGSERNALARLLDDFAHYRLEHASASLDEKGAAWVLKGESLPRSVALPYPLEPTGSASVLLRLTTLQKGQKIAFRMTCESPVSYVWSVARLDQDGKAISRVPVTYRHRGGAAALSVAPDEKTVALRLVGTNLGGVALSHPFDPDHEPHEGHGCSVAVNVIADAAARQD